MFLIRRQEPTPGPARRRARRAGRRCAARSRRASATSLGNRYLREHRRDAPGRRTSSATSSFAILHPLRRPRAGPRRRAAIGVAFSVGHDRVPRRRADRESRRRRGSASGRRSSVAMFLGFPAAAPDRARAARRRRPVPRRAGVLPRRLSAVRLQHQPGELPPGDHAGADAGPDERDDAVHRLGHDPARRRSSAAILGDDSSALHETIWVGAIGSVLALSRCSSRRSGRCARCPRRSTTMPAGPGDGLPDSRLERRPSVRSTSGRCVEHRDADAALAGDLDRPLVAGVDVAQDAHRRVRRQDALQLLGGERACRRRRRPSRRAGSSRSRPRRRGGSRPTSPRPPC